MSYEANCPTCGKIHDFDTKAEADDTYRQWLRNIGTEYRRIRTAHKRKVKA